MHIPKTGGNSIAEAYKIQGVSIWGHNLRRANYVRFPDSSISKAVSVFSPLGRFFLKSFCIVRNPWSRVFSAYNYLKAGGMSLGDKRDAEQYIGNSKSFDEFIKLNLKEASKYQLHFKPQTYWITNTKGQLVVDNYVKLEELDDHLEKVIRQFGLVYIPIKKLNSSGSQNYIDQYSEESIEIVRNVYKKEIELFDYNF